MISKDHQWRKQRPSKFKKRKRLTILDSQRNSPMKRKFTGRVAESEKSREFWVLGRGFQGHMLINNEKLTLWIGWNEFIGLTQLVKTSPTAHWQGRSLQLGPIRVWHPGVTQRPHLFISFSWSEPVVMKYSIQFDISQVSVAINGNLLF